MNDRPTAPLGLKRIAHAYLELERGSARCGESIEGVVRLKAGGEPHRITGLWVILSRGSPDSDDVVQQYDLISGTLVLPPWDEVQLPFRMTAPERATLGQDLGLSAHVLSGLWAQTLWVTVRLLPPADCELIVNELSDVAEMAVARWSVLNEGRGIGADLQAGTEGSIFDSVRLRLFWHKDTFYGELLLDTRQGVLSKLVGTDVHEFPVRFGRSDPQAAREQFREIIERVTQRCGPSRHLPIPSESSHTEALPLPGHATDADGHAAH